MTRTLRLFVPGDINAFFGLVFDNMSSLVIMATILTTAFGMPAEIVLGKMVPGSAVGVLFGDLCYTWMARRLALRSGRDDVTAMPLGLDTPSTFGLTFGVLGPTWLASHDALLTWQVGMATLVLMGLFKIAVSFCGPTVRRLIPRAGLLGSIAAVALLLIAYLPTLRLFASPVVGFLSLAVVLAALLARIRLPGRIPGAFAGILCGTILYYLLAASGLLPHGIAPQLQLPEWRFALPLPTFAFIGGLERGIAFLPLALPFALATVIGGVDVTESAAAAGDDYNTRDILLVEGCATLLAGLCGGVIQSTPYIGHPAYKEMGGRSGYTLLTALFIGCGAIFGYLSFVIALLPEAAVAPILLFIGVEITAQAFEMTPTRHYRAIALAFLPAIACLVQIEFGLLLGSLGKGVADLSGDALATWRATNLLGNGFIVTSLLWGGGFAALLDHRLRRSAVFMLICAAATSCGVIHSPAANGAAFWPGQSPDSITNHLATAYMVMALLFYALSYRPTGAESTLHHRD